MTVSMRQVRGGRNGCSEATATTATVDEDTLALDDLELSELTSEFDEERSPADDLEAPSEVSIMLDLDEPSGLAEPNEPELPEPIQLDDIEALDFELPKAEPEGIAVRREDTISDSLDLDSMMAEAEAAVDAGDSTLSLDSEFSADELQAQLDELSDLSVLDSTSNRAGSRGGVEPPAGLGLVEEDSGSRSEGRSISRSIWIPRLTSTSDDEQRRDSWRSARVGAHAGEPVDEDEVATKLDLARAYVEMGDDDGARGILEEVVAEGNQAQRGDAETLLWNSVDYGALRREIGQGAERRPCLLCELHSVSNTTVVPSGAGRYRGAGSERCRVSSRRRCGRWQHTRCG